MSAARGSTGPTRRPRGGLELARKGDRPDQGVLEQGGGRALVRVQVADPGADDVDPAGGRRGFGDEEDGELRVTAEVVREGEGGRDGPGDLVHPPGTPSQVVQRERPARGDPVGQEEEPTHAAGSLGQEPLTALGRAEPTACGRRRGAAFGTSVVAGAGIGFCLRSSQISSPSSW